MEQAPYENCIQILQEELIPAFGCTEPIAVAYAAAKAREVLGVQAEHISVYCSGNIIKNVKSVVVPCTAGRKGIEIAALIGMLGGDPSNALEVLHNVTEADRAQAVYLLQRGICKVGILDTKEKLHIDMRMSGAGHTARVELMRTHTGITSVEKDGRLLFSAKPGDAQSETDSSFLNFQTIYEFAQVVEIDRVREILDRQISYNSKIAAYGLEHSCGASIGKILLSTYGTNVKTLARALPAAGSDARMCGCELPVVINSGSGNQGMTVSLPVIVYAKELKADEDQLYRALCISNLTAIYQKREIGRLSAYCGAISAAAGAGAGIAYLMGGSVQEISMVVSNTLANVSGIFCDGAKASCAAKISSSIEAALLALELTLSGHSFQDGDGIVQTTPDATVKKVAQIAREGMRHTDEVILHTMIRT